MKKALLAALLLGNILAAKAQNQGIYFNGVNQHLSFSGRNFPAGNSPRTLEFWMRSDLRADAFENHESVVELGTQGVNGSAFGVFTERAGGKNYLSFWGHNLDKRWMAELPDEQWHFVALTYDGTVLRCYLDAVLRYELTLGTPLVTAADRCYVGGKPERKWYYKGTVGNVSIWNTARSAQEVGKDMIPYHGAVAPFTLTAAEPGLVAAFPLAEGTGTTFRNLGGTITGQLVNGPVWTKAIAPDPDPTEEGVWFVIQNKSEVDADVAKPAKRMALTIDARNAVVMAPVPLAMSSDCAAFLWRTLKLSDGSGRYRLVNKKLGLGKVLDCSTSAPVIGDAGNYSGQQWVLQNADKQAYGTNVYTLTNEVITTAKVIRYDNGAVVVGSKAANDAKQAWVFQPMMLAAGYHLPTTEAAKAPHTKKLDFGSGYTLYGSNTTSDWAMLNAHLTYKNMLGSLTSGALTTLAGRTDITRREVNFLTRYDLNSVAATYPLINAIWSQQDVTNYRGSSGYDPSRNLSVTTITEEMMCKEGVFSRYRDGINNDYAYREYDQVVHEFGHTIDNMCRANGGNIPVSGGCISPAVECFAASTQAWFNSNFSYTGFAQTRTSLPADQKNYLSNTFSPANTWIPPRKLRETEPSKLLPSGTILYPGCKHYSLTERYSLSLQADGNLVVTEGGVWKWGSANSMGVPTASVTQVRFENGWLRFMNAAGNELKRIGVDAPGSMLAVSDDPGPNGAWLKVVNTTGTTLWTSR